MAVNGLSKLEKLTIQNSKLITMQGIELLLANCDELRVMKYLQNCDRISEFQINQLRQRVRDNNWDLVQEEDDCGVLVNDRADFMRKELTSFWPAIQEFIAST